MGDRARLPDLAELNRYIRKSAFNVWLGIKAVEANAEGATLIIPWRVELGGAPRMIHGGIYAAIVDVAAFAGLFAASGSSGPTIDMRVDFHANTSGGDLRATGRLVKAGRRICTAEVSIHDSAERLLATGRCVFLNDPRHIGD